MCTGGTNEYENARTYKYTCDLQYNQTMILTNFGFGLYALQTWKICIMIRCGIKYDARFYTFVKLFESTEILVDEADFGFALSCR